MIPRLVRKAALLIGATAVAGAAFAVTPAPAFAADSIQPVAISVLPYCVQASDSPGRSAQLCVNSIREVGVSGFTTSEAVTATGSLTVCTSTYSCTTEPMTLNTTGVGLNSADAVPTITSTGTTSVPLTQFCVSSICTPNAVNVPTYRVTLFPPGAGPLTGVCVDGLCNATPLAPVIVSNATTNELLASISAS